MSERSDGPSDDHPTPPSALRHWSSLARLLGGRRPVVFLDFDGTLSPIVDRPDQATILPRARQAVERLAELVPVIVVSGRARSDVAARVGLDRLIYAGSHGFDIAGPGVSHQVAPEIPPLIERVATELSEALAGVAGAEVEPKGWTVAVHFRRVSPQEHGHVEAAVADAVANRPELVTAHGKMVLEVRPTFAWDKGSAVLHLLAALGLDGDGTLPIYVGDDLTDEDAFRALAARPGGGLGIRVADEPAATAADYSLAAPEEVPELLERLAAVLDAPVGVEDRDTSP